MSAEQLNMADKVRVSFQKGYEIGQKVKIVSDWYRVSSLIRKDVFDFEARIEGLLRGVE